MYGETWCQGDTNYCVQINKIKGKRNYNKVIKFMDDWSLTGEGVPGMSGCCGEKVLICLNSTPSTKKVVRSNIPRWENKPRKLKLRKRNKRLYD